MKKIVFIVVLTILNGKFAYSDAIKIIDGDTLWIENHKIRFSGIDAPELKQICFKNGEEILCGILAKKALKKKIGNNIPKCISEGEDKYKRILAECFVNGKSLSRFLVRNGYAFAFRKYSKKFIKDEDYAKKNKLGIWSMKFIYPWEFRKL
tara:strand:- start:1238 stop:1690 length:453 start_codon:yes stop_codon:yes gene_type:complete